MGFFSDIGDAVKGFTEPFASVMPLVSGVLGFAGQQEANSANAAQASENRSFQERLSSTAYQRAVADMKAAGLNPMLAYSQGGASTPGGSQAVMGNAGLSGAQASSYGASSSLAGSQSDLNVASASESRARTIVAEKTADRVVAETANARTENDRILKTTDVLRQQYSNLEKEGQNLTEIGNQLRASILKIKADTRVANAEELLKGVLKTLTENQSTLTGLDVEAARQTNNIGREFGQFKPLIDALTAILRIRR